jgi:hypothetical protein
VSCLIGLPSSRTPHWMKTLREWLDTDNTDLESFKASSPFLHSLLHFCVNVHGSSVLTGCKVDVTGSLDEVSYTGLSTPSSGSARMRDGFSISTRSAVEQHLD